MERNTRQRSAILGSIETAARPLSPAEIHDLARTDIPALGLATVYRNIRMLIEDGRLREVDLPGEPPRYELANLGHHHHFKCRQCDRVFDIAECATDWNRLAPAGFSVDAHDVTLFGRCDQCSGQQTEGDAVPAHVHHPGHTHD
ncbi:Fur family transcriptional regulator [Methyloversatilis sp.]|uniref:Fur family transcriptional regulator n=1 Tax=Methyloversatilis sp. TaxID=2569862 RepID=UPI0027B9C73A|nr:transcriptional repressor [Methyloversatilis sp.]